MRREEENILNDAKKVSGTDFQGWFELRVMFSLMETSHDTLILKEMKLFELTFHLTYTGSAKLTGVPVTYCCIT